MDALLVGAGAMGQWLGSVLSGAGLLTELSVLDTDPQRARETAETVGGRAVSPETVPTADLVCIAVPIPAAADAIATYAGYADAAILDVTGTMARPVDAMTEHAPDCERLSLHPLFAPENEPGNVPAVVDAGGPITDDVLAALRDRGNDVFETTVEEHDAAMETVQARTHAAVLAFGLAAEEVPERFQTPISTELTRLAEQVTGGESRVYADIQAAFEGADDVAEAARRLADADAEQFERLYDEARLETPE
ncbi:prephenate dehydrogenase/arogenate dehydrogenase family protein [Halovenus sp. WSH3]|uniref:Prephenate dehydrogenase/arogenate dehydrogenase family protein n=1 Tax=Halovenus carboxidivorans TaxID=2692199 RepID=A0A6B0TGE0_9EURY|nr:prephenate dehydrogenase/arogenate dehydrogenase family protein [Halovenus carboxidivorans]MXR52249.1 prephenate dehydrogenase/arogenate dehydrogenase family protein [Halovenus carboxidivorans]